MRKKIVTGLLAAVLLVSVLASTALVLGDSGGDTPRPSSRGRTRTEPIRGPETRTT